MLKITELAQKYFLNLLSKQEKLGAEFRVYITDFGTDNARCGICFCYSDSFLSSDVIISFDYISVRVEQKIIPFLKDSIIDLINVELGSQLVFKAPYAKKSLCDSVLLGNDSSKKEDIVENDYDHMLLAHNINNVLEFQINPQLSAHGGGVSLVNITDDLLVVLRFSGGCNGCAMASYTMKLGIEKTLKKFFPKIKGICDVTEHHHGDHSYY